MEVIRQPTTGGTPVELQEVGLYPFAPDDGMRQIRSSLGGGILMVATPSITTPAATAATTQEV